MLTSEMINRNKNKQIQTFLFYNYENFIAFENHNFMIVNNIETNYFEKFIILQEEKIEKL